MYELLFDMTEGEEEDTANLNTMTDTIDEVLVSIAAALNRADATPSTSNAAGNARSEERSGTRPKPNEALRPFQLTEDRSLVELASWILKFKAYFSSSKFANCPIEEQQAYFRNLVDVNLESRIANRILPTTPVLSGRANIVSCISILEEEFDCKYPLFSGRVALFKQQQKEGQLMSDFEAKVRANGDHAKLHELTPDDVIMLILLAGFKEKALRDKMLKEKEPSLAVFHELIRQHELAKSTSKTIDGQMKPKEDVRLTKSSKSHPTIEQLKREKKCTR